jgi:hypothetical protein
MLLVEARTHRGDRTPERHTRTCLKRTLPHPKMDGFENRCEPDVSVELEFCFIMCQIMQLAWSFDLGNYRATAIALHGTYTVERLPTGEWNAHFVRSDTEQFRRTQHPVQPRSMTFKTLADAVRACNRHAQHSDQSSDRFTIRTPPPR